MGCALTGHIMFDEIMRYNPKNPYWFNRDRFVLSAGHGCMLHYAQLHLAGYDSIKVVEDDTEYWERISLALVVGWLDNAIKLLRLHGSYQLDQIDSRTVHVSHPDYEITEGSVVFKGENLLELEPEERSHAGLFMSFRTPVEIPGVSNMDFLLMAANTKRKKHGQPELSPLEGYVDKYVKM